MIFRRSGKDISQLISAGSVAITVIGIGHIGLPLAAVMAEKGIKVYGVDRDKEVVEKVNRGTPPFYEPGLRELLQKVKARFLIATLDVAKAIKQSSVIFITVGTDCDKVSGVKLDDLSEALTRIAPHIQRGQVVILRSTVPPGTTEGLVKTILENGSGLKVEKDFGLAFCPERLVEGQALTEMQSVPHIVGGVGRRSTEAAARIISVLGSEVIEASSPSVAEMAKIFDNVYRDVNIALANELATVCEVAGVDIIETLKVCNTGPRTRVLTPGVGVGGSCLNKDPYILYHLAKSGKLSTPIISASRGRNETMPSHFLDLIKSAYSEMGKRIAGSRVAVFGVAFKNGTDDVRFSVAKPVIAMLRSMGANVVVFDPYVDCEKIKNIVGEVEVASDAVAAMRDADCLAIITDHMEFRNISAFEAKSYLRLPAAVVDGRHIFHPKEIIDAGLVYRGVGRPVSFYRKEENV